MIGVNRNSLQTCCHGGLGRLVFQNVLFGSLPPPLRIASCARLHAIYREDWYVTHIRKRFQKLLGKELWMQYDNLHDVAYRVLWIEALDIVRSLCDCRKHSKILKDADIFSLLNQTK